MDELTATQPASPTPRKLAPAALLAGTAAAIIVAAMILPGGISAFGKTSASPAAAGGGSVSGNAAPSVAPSAAKVVPSTVVGWGLPASGAAADLSKLTGKKIISIAGAMDSTTFLTADGQLFQASSDGVTDVSSKASSPIAISAGSYFTAALNRDGTVSAWGEGFDGNARAIPAGIYGMTAIAAGSSQVIALRANGSIATFGGLPGAQVDVPPTLSGNDPNASSLTATAIAAGTGNFGAIIGGGKVVTWGADAGAQPAAMAGEQIVSLAAGDRSFLALASDGKAFAWGAEYTPNSTLPDALASRTDVVQIASGNGHGLLRTKSGKVFAFGIGGFGVTDVPKDLAPVSLIGAGRSSSWSVTGPTTAAGTTGNAVAEAKLPSASSTYLAVQSWAVAEAAGSAAARGIVSNSASGRERAPGTETVTGIVIHESDSISPMAGPVKMPGGVTCLLADVIGSDPTALPSRVSTPWELAVKTASGGQSVVVWAKVFPAVDQPSCDG